MALWKNSAFQRPVSLLWQGVNGSKGTEHSGEEEPTQQGGRGGLITPLGEKGHGPTGAWNRQAAAIAWYTGRRARYGLGRKFVKVI